MTPDLDTFHAVLFFFEGPRSQQSFQKKQKFVYMGLHMRIIVNV